MGSLNKWYVVFQVDRFCPAEIGRAVGSPTPVPQRS